MEPQEFRAYLEGRGLTAAQIDQHLAILNRFEVYLAEQAPPAALESARADVTQTFVGRLISTGENSEENLVALARGAYFANNREAYLTVLALLDGAEAMPGLYDKVAQVIGESARDQLFSDLPLPPLGVSAWEKAHLTRAVMACLESRASEADCQEIFSESFRHLPETWYQADVERYREIGDLDRFLEWKREAFIAQLESLRDSGELFFNQPISDEVVEFVRADPEISVGVREGDTLFVTKIPYLAEEFLAEENPELRRYYYCHCPWARESLRQEGGPVSSRFCQCSAGYHKRLWELVFERPLRADVLESVLAGDDRCRFAIHLPERI